MRKTNLNICLIEPFFSGSHKKWANEYQNHSSHNIEIISLKGVYWKWRMHGGAITLAEKFNKKYSKEEHPDLILTTDMLNLPLFHSFINKKIPTVTFFHENQLTYPWSSKDRDKIKKRDHHYGFINYSTALKSDTILFNSKFHLDSFIDALKIFLKQFPDHRGLSNIDIIKNKSIVSYLGLDLKRFDKYKELSKNKIPIILWNHRWEYDKNPNVFFHTLKILKESNIKFNLVILGEQFATEMDEFKNAKNYFADEIIHVGYCDSFKDYAKWLWKCDILPVTSNQDFFGLSIMEAIYCNCTPLLPNRLAYPELFKNNTDIFYDSNNELMIKLKKLIRLFPRLENFQDIAKNYDWSYISKNYDYYLLNTIYKNN